MKTVTAIILLLTFQYVTAQGNFMNPCETKEVKQVNIENDKEFEEWVNTIVN